LRRRGQPRTLRNHLGGDVRFAAHLVGCSVKAVQSFLGHKNASETLDTYGHLWPGDDDKIRAAIDAGFADGNDEATVAI